MAGRLAAGRFDPMAEARALYALPPAQGEAVTVAAFAQLLGRALAAGQAAAAVPATVKALGLRPEEVITRAQACELVYAAGR
jgi:hypothetical protein